MQAISRRDIIKLGALGGSSLFLTNPLSLRAAAQSDKDPHFFVQIIFPGGWDTTYLFDARPRSFFDAGKLANFLNEEPSRYIGVNGQHCLRTSLTRVLDSFLSDFSVINGIHMSTDFDGHEQNINFVMSGNPFGGETFVPWLNSDKPLDFLRTGNGNFLVNLDNLGGSALLSVTAADNLVQKIKNQQQQESKALSNFLDQQFLRAGGGQGGFANTARLMQETNLMSANLNNAFRKMSFNPPNSDPEGGGRIQDPIDQSAKLIASFLKENIAKTGIYVFDTDLNQDQNLDTHDNESARASEATFKKVLNELAVFLGVFKETEFDRNRSMYDVTTFLICSEFGRTMRQSYTDSLEKSGTDHNALTNTALIGGKGIKGGLVIGESDFQSLTEMDKISPIHKSFDPSGERIIGRPFDFESERARLETADHYRRQDYLSFNSITNTILSVFGVKEEKWLAHERNGPKSPTLKSLI